MRTTIFKQLIFNIIVPVVVALVCLGGLNYYEINRTFEKFTKDSNKKITDLIEQQLIFQDRTLNKIEIEFNKSLEKMSDTLANYILANTHEIEKINLYDVRKKMGLKDNLDFYVINSNGIVVNTTYKKDLNLNLFNFGIQFEKFLKNVWQKDRFISERFTIETSTHYIKKYTYQAVKGGKYLIQIGAYSNDAEEIVKQTRGNIDHLAMKYNSIREVDLYIGADEPFPLNVPKHDLNDQNLLKDILKTQNDRSINKKVNDINYLIDYLFFERKNTDLYKFGVIRIITDRSEEVLAQRRGGMKLIMIFMFTVIIVIFLIYKKTKVITSPIKKLVNKVTIITEGNLSERAEVEGNNEISSLSEKFNYMVERLENIYNELEEKVKERTKEILNQKAEIEEQQKDITDSLHYARRIQRAILPADEFVNTHFNNAFILYKPKDIVSGDFYWCYKHENTHLIAAVDCTGHGVPGAFMSIVGSSHLKNAVELKKKIEPSDILNSLNEGVTGTLRQETENEDLFQVRDGMDMALCSYDKEKMILKYSGAINPIYIIRNNEITIIKGDKFPIGGGGVYHPPFTNHVIPIEKGDAFYIFSDGYADQFGGPRGKKLKYSQFRKILLENHQKPLNEQKRILNRIFEEWRGHHEQIDDVLVIGLKF